MPENQHNNPIYDPLTLHFNDINDEDHDTDLSQLLIRVQTHKCNEYCIRKRLTSDERKISK